MRSKIIIVTSMVLMGHENELEDRLSELGPGWRVTAATTSMISMEPGSDFQRVHYCTTVVVEHDP